MARLTRQAWCEAALWALPDGGIAAVSVEGLAAQLGVTKGSFYHHFKGRTALLEAAVAHWAEVATEAVITRVDAHDTPRDRLRALLGESLRDLDSLRVEAALMAAASTGDPVVGPVYDAVSRRRLAYLVELYTAEQVEAPHAWAITAFASYLGGVQLAAMRPSPLSERGLEPLLTVLLDRLVPS